MFALALVLAAWLTMPSLDELALAMPPEAIARRYRVTAELVEVRLARGH